MQAWWIVAQVTAVVLKLSLVAGVCWPVPCIIEPKVMRFWYHEMELDASSFTVHEGDDISITCDGSCVGEYYNPHLRWYGPDRYWIASENKTARIHVERAHSPHFQKLHISSMTKSDEGAYFCRGKLGNKLGWRLKSIILFVVQKQTYTDNSSAGRRKQFVAPRTTEKRRIYVRTTTAQKPSTTRKPSTTWKPSTASPTHSFSTSTAATSTTTRVTHRAFTSRETTNFAAPVTEYTSLGKLLTSTTRAFVTTNQYNDTEISSHCVWPHGFLCNNGDCIDTDYRCDSFPDCFNGEDEENCDTILTCSESKFACDDNSACISSTELCDGVEHCKDGSDEFLYRCS